MIKYVKLTKLNPVDDPKFPTPDLENYSCGEVNDDVSLPNSYTVTGYIHGDVEVGMSVFITRDTRNGVECTGVLRTSPVVSFEESDNGLVINTANSIYKLEWLSSKETLH